MHKSAESRAGLESLLRQFLRSPRPRTVPPDLLVQLRGVRPEALGAAYERTLAARRPTNRKASGVYYTPIHIVEHVVDRTLRAGHFSDRLPVSPVRVLDPACGAGAFLLAAYRMLVKKLGAADFSSRRRILADSIFGVDIDPDAVDVARLSLLLALIDDHLDPGAAGTDALPDLSRNVLCGNSIVGPDCPHARRRRALDWSAAFDAPAFDVVIGNPPWGQKAVGGDKALVGYLRQRYRSVGGIHDLFRPFVERGIELTREGGMFGMVLPDIVLLKNYAPTRRYVLDHLALTHVDWWGMAFPGATIDAATIIGRRSTFAPNHRVVATVHRAAPPSKPRPGVAGASPSSPSRITRTSILQQDFLSAPRHVFNLHLTPRDRRTLQALAQQPKLGDCFEIHEGVHSGNIRADLFVAAKLDDSCEELLFGRDEIAPFVLRWKGRYVRLSALESGGHGCAVCSRVPPDGGEDTAANSAAVAPGEASPPPRRYANLGRPQWHRRPKVLLRRTGDRVIAAVDPVGRYASNNFFLVFPKRPSGLTLHGLAAWLNSSFITWFFRTIEPRTGRAFAELKIKHIRVFPLPPEAVCAELNELGQRAVGDKDLAGGIDRLVRDQLGLV
jgi:SAM-dependent methyltransferase